MSASRRREPPPGPVASGPGGRGLVPALILATAALAAYANSFSVPFLMDDDGAVLENPSLRSLTDLPSVLWPPDGTTTAGRPLLNLSFALNHAVGGTAVAGYHAVNLLIHLLSGLTLLGLVRRTLASPARSPSTQAAAGTVALIASLWWLLHPVQTASVTYISQRAEAMMGLCYLFTLYAFVRGTESPARAWWHGAAVAACAAGVSIKEPIATAPLLVLLYDRAFVSGSFPEAWRRHRPTYLGLFGTWLLLTALMLGPSHAARGVGPNADITPWIYALTEFKVVARYLGLTLWPHPLVFDYGPGIYLSGLAQALPWMIVVGLLLAATALAWRRYPPVGFLGAAFFLVLAPTSTVIPVTHQPMAENRLYLPLAAVVIGLALALHRCAGRRMVLIGAAVAGGLLTLTHARNEDYRTEQGLWEDNLAKQAGNWRAHYSLGLVYAKSPGREADAAAQFAATVRLRPDHADAFANLAAMLLILPGRGADAVAPAKAALRLDPNHVNAHFNLGLALAGQPGRLNEGLVHLSGGIRLAPNDVEMRSALANTLHTSPGRLPEALSHYEVAVRLAPDRADLHNNYAGALFRAGRLAEARRELETALRIDPNYADARANLDRLRTAAP